MIKITLWISSEEQKSLLKDYRIIEFMTEENLYQNVFVPVKKTIAIDCDKKEYTIDQAVNLELKKRLLLC